MIHGWLPMQAGRIFESQSTMLPRLDMAYQGDSVERICVHEPMAEEVAVTSGGAKVSETGASAAEHGAAAAEPGAPAAALGAAVKAECGDAGSEPGAAAAEPGAAADKAFGEGIAREAEQNAGSACCRAKAI